jgi:putative transposase
VSGEWFTPGQLAAMRLPGMPTSPQGVNLLAEREGWRAPEREGQTWRRHKGRGGGFEYHVSLLPIAAQQAIALRAAEAEDAAKSVTEIVWSEIEAAKGELLVIGAALLRLGVRLERIERRLGKTRP